MIVLILSIFSFIISYSFDGYRGLGLHPFFTTLLCFVLLPSCTAYAQLRSLNVVCAEMSVNDRRERDGWLTVLLTAITQNPRFLGGQLMLAAKLVSRRAFRLPGAKKFALTLLLVVLIVYGMFSNRLMSDSFLEVDKCPACFGFKLCTAARSGNVWFTGWSKIRLLDYVTNVDNIYTGDWMCFVDWLYTRWPKNGTIFCMH